MPIAFSCPHCGAKTNVADQFAGQTGPCAHCGNSITVPFPVGTAGFGPPAGSPARSSGGSSVWVILAVIAGVGLLMLLACGGVGFFALRGPIQSAQVAAQRAQCSNNVKQIALAMHNYHDTYGKLPPAYTVDKDGNKLHSWRTLILPFIDQLALYNQIDLNEPWDSPKNQHVAQVSIPTFNCEIGSKFTDYVVIADTGTMFEGAEGVGFGAILDGTSNTLMVVEIPASDISWMEPRDVTLSEFVSKVQAGSTLDRHPGGLNAAMGDGSVRFLTTGLPENVLRSLATRAGGEEVNVP